MNTLTLKPLKPAALLPALLAALFILAARAWTEPGWPEPSPGGPQYDGKLAIDTGNSAQGYFLASVSSPVSHRLKLRVEKDGTTLTYDLNGDTETEVFPLQLGDGEYQVSLYENVGGKKYSQEGRMSFQVSLADQTLPFLYPNQYLNYTSGSPVMAEAETLCGGLSPKEAFQAVCSFMKTDFMYDYVKAVTVSPGELPGIDESFDKRMGICQDLSAIMVSMLRMQGIPSRLMIGYADQNYHAWVEADVDGDSIFFDPTLELGAMPAPNDYSVERYY